MERKPNMPEWFLHYPWENSFGGKAAPLRIFSRTQITLSVDSSMFQCEKRATLDTPSGLYWSFIFEVYCHNICSSVTQRKWVFFHKRKLHSHLHQVYLVLLILNALVTIIGFWFSDIRKWSRSILLLLWLLCCQRATGRCECISKWDEAMTGVGALLHLQAACLMFLSLLYFATARGMLSGVHWLSSGAASVWVPQSATGRNSSPKGCWSGTHKNALKSWESRWNKIIWN